MKKVLFCIAIAAISISAKSQSDSVLVNSQPDLAPIKNQYEAMGTSDSKKTFWSIAVNPSMPIGHFNTYTGFGLGGSVGVEYKPSKDFGLTLSLGYIDYFGKTTNGIKYSDFKYIPLLGGVKYYFGGSNVYMHGEAGAGFGTSDLGTSFWYGGGLGYRLARAIDTELKYVGWHQNLVSNTNNNIPYQPGQPGQPAQPGDPGYGGHYSTIDLKIAFTF